MVSVNISDIYFVCISINSVQGSFNGNSRKIKGNSFVIFYCCVTCNSIIVYSHLMSHKQCFLKIKNHIKEFVIFKHSIFLLFETNFQILKIIPQSFIMADLNYGSLVLTFLQKQSFFIVTACILKGKHALYCRVVFRHDESIS